MHSRLSTTFLLLVALVLGTAGCSDNAGSGGGKSTAALQQASLQLQPADKDLAGIYNRSCRSCHTVAATGAPLTGDSAGWAERMAKGMPTLVDNVVNGYGGMPPYGLCMDCDAAQFEALIDFMAAEG
ncbi:MAG: c-type cytochrome [Halioglobus sp.]|nr:c-type cytochrome [Halioglobus sp.]